MRKFNNSNDLRPAKKPGHLSRRIARYGLSAHKKLGQHFILDPNLNRRIVENAGNLDGATILEIGPGPGGLTEALLKTGARRIIAIERDQRCITALQPLMLRQPDRLCLIKGDARELSVQEIANDPANDAGDGVVIIANLPYNIATFLVLHWLGLTDCIQHMVLMFQKEVAERLAAAPGNKAYGRLSVLAQWRWDIRTCMQIPARAFTPPPKVDSTLLSLKPLKEPLYEAEEKSLSRVTKAAFGQRRKMLRRSLRSLGPEGVALAENAGLDPNRRGETLSIGEFCALARALQAITGNRSSAVASVSHRQITS